MDIAALGTRLVRAIADGPRVLVHVDGDLSKETPALPANLMPPAIAVSPSGEIAICARTGTGQVYGCILGKPWVYLGPSNTRQGVAWHGRFLFGRVVWSEGRLYEQTIEYVNGIGQEIDLRSERCDSAGGIHYFDTLAGKWFPVAPRETKVGSLTLYRPVRRVLPSGQIVYCGQVPGSPDYQAIATSDGKIAFRAAEQIEYPTFIVIGERLVCVDRRNVVRSFTPPYPTMTPTPAPTPTPVPPKPTEPAPVDPTNLVPNYKSVFAAARQYYKDRFPQVGGMLRAHLVLNLGAWNIRDSGAGLYYKKSGTRFEDRSLDIVIFKGIAKAPSGKGPTFDALKNAETTADAIWNSTYNPAEGAIGFGDLANWREPVNPETLHVKFGLTSAEPPPPPPPPEPPPPTTDYRAQLVAVRGDVAALLARIDAVLG